VPKVTVYRPNRTKERYFTPCAVARIAWNCHDDTGAAKEDILMCAAKRLGFRVIALPTADRDLPERAANIVERLKRLIGNVEQFVSLITDWVEAFGSGLDTVLSIFPDFLLDNQFTIEDKLLKRATKSRRSRAIVNAIKLVDKVRDKVKEIQLDLEDLLAQLERVQGMIQFGEQAKDLEIYETSDAKNCQCNKQHTEAVKVSIGEYTLHFIYSEQVMRGRRGVIYRITYDGVTEGGSSEGNPRFIAMIREKILAVYGSEDRLAEIIRTNTNFDSSGIENSNPGFLGGGGLGLEWTT